MRRLIPDSLFGRISVVLVIGLVVTHFASTAIHYSDRDEALAMLSGGVVAERIAAMARLLEDASPEDRPWIVHTTSRPGFSMSWDARPALPANSGGGLHERIMEAMLSLSLGDAGVVDTRVLFTDPDSGDVDWIPDRPGAGVGHMSRGMESMMRYHTRMMVSAGCRGL